MPSQRYFQLRTQIGQLSRSLLPRLKKGEPFDLSPRLSLRALSYRVLCHAEIETYLEDRALEIAQKAFKSWKDKGHICRPTLYLLAFSGLKFENVPDSLKPPPKRKQSDWDNLIKPHSRISQATSSYLSFIRFKNNGIKEENILKLLIPLGFDIVDLDELFLAELNDFGTKRGEAAHVSTAGHVTRGVNPLDEAAQVRRILDSLRQIDSKLDLLLADAG